MLSTPNMILCFINSCNWTENLNTGAYIAEVDPYYCDNSEGQRVEGKVQYRWIVNALGRARRRRRRAHRVQGECLGASRRQFIHADIDTQMVIKKDDLVVKGEEVFVKKLTFTYKTPAARR